LLLAYLVLLFITPVVEVAVVKALLIRAAPAVTEAAVTDGATQVPQFHIKITALLTLAEAEVGIEITHL